MIAIESFAPPHLAANDNIIAMSHFIKTTPHPSRHVPVMLDETLTQLDIKDGGIYVDATYGHGGYTKAMLNEADCVVYAVDRDPAAEDRATQMLTRYDGRLRFVPGCFGDLEDLLHKCGVHQIDGIVFDLGVASSQLDEAERGFSFRQDGPLNMRMDGGRPNATDVINSLDTEELTAIISKYGEERFARRIAAAIAEARKEQPITRTLQLADIIRKVTPRSKDGIDPATRTFQALRIYVNDELGELERGLVSAERLLSPGGKLVAVSYHSLEDRIVKDFLRKRSGHIANPSRHAPVVTSLYKSSFELSTRKALIPEDSEIKRNPRAASAKLRAAERTEAPAWPCTLITERERLFS